MQLHKPGGRPDYEALAVPRGRTGRAEALHLTALLVGELADDLP